MEGIRLNIDSVLEASRLRLFLERQRWFAGKAQTISAVGVVDLLEIDGRSWLAIIAVTYEGGARQEYLLPLAVVDATAAEVLHGERPEAMFAEVDGGGMVIDGVFDNALCSTLLAMIQGDGEFQGRGGAWKGRSVVSAAPIPTDRIRRTAPDQSNTSILFGDVAILKLFRRIEAGTNPDLEIGAHLTRLNFPQVPRTLGTLEYQRTGRPGAAVAMLQQFVPNRGNGWEVMLQGLASVANGTQDSTRESQWPADTLPSVLGRRTGELHVHLARGDDEAFAPEPLSGTVLRDAAAAMHARAEAHLDLLAASLSRLDEPTRARATQVLNSREALLNVFAAMAALEDAGQRIRCHGDYHLGQILITDDDVVILDFEGEPARALVERRAKSSPLRDVAGMLRSFSYAATTAARSRDREVAAAGTPALDAWEADAARVFLRSYLDAVAGTGMLPRESRDRDALLRAYVVDKAVYEVGYELNNRPDWVAVPLAGVLRGLQDAKTTVENGE